jgi:hypothetical protein
MSSALTFPTRGVDYAFDRPNLAQLQAEGYRFVFRYLTGGAPKALSSGEVQALHARNFHIGLYFEATANGPQAGRSQGVKDASQAAQACHDLGVPRGIVVYFAIDYELTAANSKATHEYLQAADHTLAQAGRHAGAYGGIATMGLARLAGIPYGCQTLAWSGGRWDQQATVWQNRVNIMVAGAQVDGLRALRSFGGWEG